MLILIHVNLLKAPTLGIRAPFLYMLNAGIYCVLLTLTLLPAAWMLPDH